MTEAKFTPGPWIAFKGAGWCVSRPNAKMAHMVGMDASFSLVGAESADKKEAEANAHLIAAAPDLYEALSSVLWAFQNMEPSENPNEYAKLILDISAVQAKARGES